MTCMFKAMHYCLPMYLTTLETIVLKYMNLIQLFFCLHLDFLKKTWAKLELLINIDMLLVEKGIRGGTCHAIHRYAKENNKYMKNYD